MIDSPVASALSSTPFTIAICTLDRSTALKDTVSRVLEQISAFPNGCVVIVDNGSSDGTTDDLAALATADCRVRWFAETRRGLYYARARAINAARGDFIIFLDDDALPQDGWLLCMVGALVAHPNVGVVGCAIDAFWETPRPRWLSPRLESAFSILACDTEEVFCKFPVFPIGVCIGLRLNNCARLYMDITRHDDYPLGRIYSDSEFSGKDALLGGEETDLCEIFARNGFDVLLIPSARVFHRVSDRRMTPDYIARKFEGDGRTMIRLLRLTGRGPWSYFGSRVLLPFPILTGLKLVAFLLPKTQSILVDAYFHKSLGAWRELLFGSRLGILPYRIDHSANFE